MEARGVPCPANRPAPLARRPFETLRTGSFDTLRTGHFDRLRTGPFDRLRTGRFGTLRIKDSRFHRTTLTDEFLLRQLFVLRLFSNGPMTKEIRAQLSET
jgi:hypothetical protein